MYLDKHYLLTPGPSPVPELINHQMTLPMIGHRTPEFENIMQQTTTQLQTIFGAEHPVVILSGSGTSALETAMVNVASPDDLIVIIVSGAFGNRFKQIAEQHPFHIHILEVEWGKAVTVEELDAFLSDLPAVKAVFTQACETSTAVVHPVADMGRLIHASYPETLFIVDAVSIAGAMHFDMTADYIDVITAGSQKAMMLPPGLAFIAYSTRAKATFEANITPVYYFDLNKYINSLQDNTTPFTPAVGLIRGVHAYIQMVEQEGFNETVKRHTVCRDMLRAGLQALDLPLLVDNAAASTTVTAFIPPAQELSPIKSQLMKQHHISIAGGQGKLKGHILRIGHMGYITPNEIIIALAALEQVLSSLRSQSYYGEAVKQAQEVLAHAL